MKFGGAQGLGRTRGSPLRKYRKIVQKINSFDFSRLDDSHLSCLINEFRAELSGGKSSADVLLQVFAIIREVIDRRLGIWKLFDADSDVGALYITPQGTYDVVRERRARVDDSQIHLESSFYKAVREMRQSGDGLTFWPYDVQLMGALALYEGNLAEMGTGEGKTVVAVFPACLWALSGKRVHIATVNDYLALRDYTWMGPAYRFLELNVGCVLSHIPDAERREAYRADIVYGNNYEFGFDYLRDNIKNRLEDRVQCKLECVIIDEVDSILMDEATTPLIISGEPEGGSHQIPPSPPLLKGGTKLSAPEPFMKGENLYWKLKPTVELLLERQSELVDRLLHEVGMEEDSRSKFIKLVQIAKADPWNGELLDYLSNNEDASKGMRAIQSKFAAARSEYKLEAGLFYVVDERLRTVKLADRGMALVEQQLGQGFMTLGSIGANLVSAPEKAITRIAPTGQGEEVRNFLQLLRAYVLHRRDEDYIVRNDSIVIVDEFTGRLAFGKKYEEGLHQAIECKERLQITPENRVVGRITHPNYFRLYGKMVGMTATAHTEAEEFKKLYDLEVVRIPTNKPVIRVDLPDRLYKTEEQKLEAIIKEIQGYHSLGRPVLVGTRSVEKSECLSAFLTQRGIPHNTLNAKNHAREAEIIKSAGQPYAVTIATNMAGRGTDIALGDSRLGLHVIGSERHSARRIDHQLRGRAGRQGDPGSSRFYLSLQDDLFRVFGREEMSAIVKTFDRSRRGESCIRPDVARLVRRAQRKSEEMSYHIRRQLIQRDDIADKQRRAIYRMRQEILTGDWTKACVQSLTADHAADIMDCRTCCQLVQSTTCHTQAGSMWYSDCQLVCGQYVGTDRLRDYCMTNFRVLIPKLDIGMSIEEVERAIVEAFEETYERRERALGVDFSHKLGKAVMIDALETAWADYLSFQSEFDKSLSLRSHVRSDTLTDYRLESSKLFNDLLASIRREALRDIFTYPLPGEKIDSISWAGNPKSISKEVKELLSIL